MKLQTNDVLNEIEFELMQGIVSREDLGEGIQTVQKYQNQVRSEVLDAHHGDIPLRDALSRQLQINDLLLSLIQETAAKVHTLQSELYRSAHMIQHPPSETEYPETAYSETAYPEPSTLTAAISSAITSDSITSDTPPADDNILDDESTDHPSENLVRYDLVEIPPDLKAAMSVQALQIEPEIRVIEIPIIGGFLTRLRVAIHDLVLFYTRRLASKQAVVNQTYGEQLLNLHQTEQQLLKETEALRTQIIKE